MQYRRAKIQGAVYFFTVNLADRKSTLLTDEVHVLRESVNRVKAAHPFNMLAWVVLPEHIHMVWRLPPSDADFAKRWKMIKARFSRAMPHGEFIRDSRLRKGERGIWQRRYWEHLVRDDLDLERCVDYLHFNPVKHGLVYRVVDWPYSSFHEYVLAGRLPRDWGGDKQDDGDFGER